MTTYTVYSETKPGNPVNLRNWWVRTGNNSAPIYLCGTAWDAKIGDLANTVIGQLYDVYQCDERFKDGDVFVYQNGIAFARCHGTQVVGIYEDGGAAKPTKRSRFTITYSSIDGCRETRRYKHLTGARRYAQAMVGKHPCGISYAVSDDGIGKVTWEGCTMADLFPEALA